MGTTTTQFTTTAGPTQAGGSLLSLVPGRRPGLFQVRLDLPFRPVFIGTLEGDTYRKRIDPSKHLHHNSDSVAISAALLYGEHIRFKWIVVEMPGKKLITTRQYFLAHAKPHQFRNFEPQLFLPVAEFGVERVRNWEKEQEKQERHRRELAAQTELFEAVA